MGRLARWFGAGEPDPDEVVELAYVPLHDSQLMVSALARSGIESFAVDDARSSGVGGVMRLPMSRLFARRRDLPRAAEIIDGWPAPAEGGEPDGP